jgi:hypothetical protein
MKSIMTLGLGKPFPADVEPTATLERLAAVYNARRGRSDLRDADFSGSVAVKPMDFKRKFFA